MTNFIKTNLIEVNTCNGVAKLCEAEYIVVRGAMVTIKWHYDVTDPDMTRLHNIIETQLRAERAFCRDVENDSIQFDYPFSLIVSMMPEL